MERLPSFAIPAVNLNTINLQNMRTNVASHGNNTKVAYGSTKRSTDSRGSGSVASGSDGSQSYVMNSGSFPQAMPQYHYYPSSYFPMHVHPSSTYFIPPSDPQQLQRQQQQQQKQQQQQPMQSQQSVNNGNSVGQENGSFPNSNQAFYPDNSLQIPYQYSVDPSSGQNNGMIPQPYFAPFMYNLPATFQPHGMIQQRTHSMPYPSGAYGIPLAPLNYPFQQTQEGLPTSQSTEPANNSEAIIKVKEEVISTSKTSPNTKEGDMQLVSQAPSLVGNSGLAGTNITAANNIGQDKSSVTNSNSRFSNAQDNGNGNVVSSNLAPPPVSKISLAFRQRQAAILANANNPSNGTSVHINSTHAPNSSVSMTGSSSRYSEGSGGMSCVASTVGATTTSGHSQISSESSLTGKDAQKRRKKSTTITSTATEKVTDLTLAKEEDRQLYYGFLDDYKKSHPSHHSHHHRSDNKAGKGPEDAKKSVSVRAKSRSKAVSENKGDHLHHSTSEKTNDSSNTQTTDNSNMTGNSNNNSDTNSSSPSLGQNSLTLEAEADSDEKPNRNHGNNRKNNTQKSSLKHGSSKQYETSEQQPIVDGEGVGIVESENLLSY